MRLYLKLFLLIAVFACASRWQLRRTISDLAYDARLAFVCAFGSTSDYEALIDDTQRRLARERGNLELYLKGQRYKQLLAERLAAAAGRNIALSEEDLDRIRVECTIEAFAPVERLTAPDRENKAMVSAARADDESRQPPPTTNKSGR